MSRKLEDLKPDFRLQCERVLDRCKDAGVEMVPFYTARSVYEQARLWRQSRSSASIWLKIRALSEAGAPFLSSVLQSVGPQYGRWATNAVPGLSYHNWGEAMDCFVLHCGRALWGDESDDELREIAERGYLTYAQIAEDEGLYSLYHWGDKVHVQSRKGNLLGEYTWPEIDRAMANMWRGEK